MALTNSQVVPAILRGEYAENARGSFWGDGSPSRWTRASRGYMPHKVGKSLDIVADRNGGITGIIMSYATPIAVQIAGIWLCVDTSYSTTTSAKHMPHLPERARWLPTDASVEDVENVLAGYTVYDPWKKAFRRGHAARPETQRYWRELAARDLAEAVAA